MPQCDAGELASPGVVVTANYRLGFEGLVICRAFVRRPRRPGWPRFDAAGRATRSGDTPPAVTAYPLGDLYRLWRPDPPR
jgi:hypothetical protein